MYFSIPSYNFNNFYRSNCIYKAYKTLEVSLALVKKAIKEEREDELFYDYLISVAPTEEEKNIIATIRDDERKHNKYFREIYEFYTGESISLQSNENFIKPEFYIDGIRKAKLGELGAVEKYRDIRAGIPHEYYRDMVFEILTDELKHSHKYDYILYLSLLNKATSKNESLKTSNFSFKTEFIAEEAIQIAKNLGIDFSKEKFDLNQFIMGLNTELEHGKKSPLTNVTEDDPLITAKIALAHLHEFPDYYTRLAKLEEEAKAYWSTPRNYFRRTKEFTLSEIAQYDGTMEKPAYVAINGIVYDVSDNPKWSGAVHYGLSAGKDLSSQFESCHGVISKLANLPKVGVLKL